MKGIGLALLVLTTVAQADQLSQAISLLRDSDPSSKVQGARMAKRMGAGAKKAAPQLIKNLGHDDWGVRHEMKLALKSIRTAASPALI